MKHFLPIIQPTRRQRKDTRLQHPTVVVCGVLLCVLALAAGSITGLSRPPLPDDFSEVNRKLRESLGKPAKWSHAELIELRDNVEAVLNDNTQTK